MSTVTTRIEKVNLIYGKGTVLNSHLNINPFASEETDSLIRGKLSCIDDHVDDGEASELIAEDVIDFLPTTEVNASINNWVSKIKPGGTIVIGGVDAFEVAKSFSQYQIDLTDFNHLIHGEQTERYLFRRTNFSTYGMCEFLESLGLKIIKKRTNNHKYIIEAQKNDN